MKKTIYLLPGLMCNEQLWSRIHPLLKESYELIFLELPLKTNFDEMIEELDLVLPKAPINLLGFSLGGYLASYFAVKHPHRVSKLLIVGNSASPILEEEITRRKQAIHLCETVGFKGLSRQKVKSLLEDENHNDEMLISLIQQMYVDLGEEVYKVQMEATLYRSDLFDHLLDLNIPLHFVYSLKDRLIDSSWLKKFQKQSPNAMFITNDSASHMLPLERPKELALSIHNWINV
jgi:pimeloyl-ACP methyl ester carboxylesterase